MMLDNVILRTPEIMREVIDCGRAKEFSIHEDPNFFWDIK